jgi:hypothetical protein
MMTVRLRQKMIALAAIVSLLAALLPAAVWADSPAGTEAETETIANGGFEEIANGKPAGWIGFGSGAVYESVYQPVHGGNFSVKLTDNSPQGGNGIRSSSIPAVPGNLYKASVYGRNESGTSQLYLEFWNAANQRIDVKIATVPAGAQWNAVEIVAEAPAGAVGANVLLYQHQSNVGVAYFDDASLQEVPLVMPYNGGFEEVAGGKPVGWTSLSPSSVYSSDSTTVHSGVYSLKMEDLSTTSGPGLRSSSMPVIADKLYEASVYSYNESGVSQMYLEFWNSSNVRIVTKIITNSAIGSWEKLEIQSEAPAGATYATLLMYQHVGNQGTAYFDDAMFRLAPPEPVREFPLLNASHPRLYFTPADLPSLQSRAQDTVHAPFGRTGKQLWDSIKSTADAYLTETSFSRTYYAGKVVTFPLPPVQPGPIENPPGFTSPYPYWTMMTRSIQERLETLSLAYAVSGNTAYADKAKSYVLSLAGWNSWTDPTYPCGGETCLDTSHLTFGVSMAFDILYDVFTEAERTQVMTALENKGLIPLYKDARNKLDHNIQSLRAAALGSGAAVLLGHSPNANAYLTRAMNYYQWYLDERMTSGQQEGLLYTSYAMDNMIKAFDHINRVTGVQELADHPFINDFLVRWIVYALAPGGGGLANFSDSGAANYFGLTMNVINAWLNNGQAGWYLQETGAAASGNDGFLYFRPNAVITSPDEWPASAVLDEIGWALLRSGWEADDMLFGMVGNNSNLGHNHFDQNSFQIATNRTWIAGDAGYQDYVAGPANDLTVRLGHSTIQVDGQGQTVRGRGSLTEGLLAPTYDYIKGSAAGAYGNPKLDRFDRHVVYLKPDTFVMLDELEADAPHVYDWVLFSGALNHFEVNGQEVQAGQTTQGNGLYVRSGGAELAAKFLADTTLPITVTQHPGAESYGYYTKVGSGAATADHRFLTVLKARPYQPQGLFDESNLLPLTDSSGREAKLVQASGSTVIFYRGAGAGDYMTVTVNVPEDGTYSLKSRFLQSPLYGIVQTYVDGQPAGGAFDGYAPDVTGPVTADQGNLQLTAGTHTIRYEVTGKNALSGNYFIGLDAVTLLPANSPELEQLEVSAAMVTGTNGVGASVDREDGSGVRDLVVFRTGTSGFTVGAVTGDAEQAVVSYDSNDDIVGFKMTRGSSLLSGGSVLLAGSSAFSASFDTSSETLETEGIVDTAAAQNISIHAPADALIYVDGQLLGQGSYMVNELAGTVELALTAGRHQVRIVSLSARIDAMIESWGLTPPASQIVSNTVRQMLHHWNRDNTEQAIARLERLQDHLNKPPLLTVLPQEIRSKIQQAVQEMIGLLGG